MLKNQQNSRLFLINGSFRIILFIITKFSVFLQKTLFGNMELLPALQLMV